MKSGKFKTKREHILSLWDAGKSYWAISVNVGCHENYVGEVVRTYKKQMLNKQADKEVQQLAAAFKASSKPDMVNSPPHYTVGGIEVIDFIEAKLSPEEFRGYLKGNLIKYLSRAPYKGEEEQDAGKVRWYSDRLEKSYKKSK